MDQTVNHTERDHALLGASGAKRWMTCIPSARLEDLFPSITSRWAEEGSRRHEIAEQLLRAKVDGRSKPGFKDPEKKQMVLDVQMYVDYVWDTYQQLSKQHKDAVLMLEQKVSYDEYVPGGFGTCDTLIIAGTTLILIDLKTGHKPVYAEGNEQLRLYCLGALQEYGDIYDNIESVEYHIVQPPLDRISSENIALEDLMFWVNGEVVPKAKLAYEGKGAFVEGDHCKYCNAEHCCRHRLNNYQAIVALQDRTPEELASTGEITTVLRNLAPVRAFLASVEYFAISAIQNGVTYEGVKLVQGSGKTVLKEDAEDELVRRLLAAGANATLLYKPKELVTKSDQQKLIGKKKYEELTADLYEKTPGKLSIDRAESKAAAWTPPNSTQSDFAEEDLTSYATA